MTLAQKALATPRKRKPQRKSRRDSTMSSELIDLGILWAFDRVSFGQCASAMGVKNNNNLYVHLAWGLRQAARQDRLRQSRLCLDCGGIIHEHSSGSNTQN